MSTPNSGHAVVIGAGIAGLLAARALSSSFGTVTVFDRDTLPSSPVPRRGIPQGQQFHGLLARGAQGLEHLLPGILGDMDAAGVPRGDLQADFSWYIDGHKMAGAASGLIGYGASRPLFESLIRNRVAALPNVTVTEGAEVASLVSDGAQVTGVQVRHRGSGAVGTMPAELVVDAAGRGSRIMTWLGEMGFPLPEETVIRLNVVYVTRHYKQGPGLLEGRFGASVVPYPGNHRAGAVVRQEDGLFVVLLYGMVGEDHV